MKPRRGQASIIGSILFFVLFAAAMAGVSYYASSQSQANSATNRAQSLMAQKNDELLQYGALSNGTLMIQNAGGESAGVIEAIIKYSNGTVYTTPLSTSSLSANNALQVGRLIPNSLQFRYNAVLSSANPADEIGLVTSRGNTFWLKPAVAVQSATPGTTVQMTFAASGDSPFGSNPVLTVDGTNYNQTQLPVTLTWFVGTKHAYAWQTLPQGTGTRVAATVTGLAKAGSGSITATATGGIAATFTTQYLLAITGGSGVTVNPSSPAGDGWYNEGAVVQLTTSYVWGVVAGQSRLNLVSWNLDGGNNQPVTRGNSGTYTTAQITMNAPHAVNFNSVTQYYVTVQNNVPASGSTGSLTVSFSYQVATSFTGSGTLTTDNHCADGANISPSAPSGTNHVSITFQVTASGTIGDQITIAGFGTGNCYYFFSTNYVTPSSGTNTYTVSGSFGPISGSISYYTFYETNGGCQNPDPPPAYANCGTIFSSVSVSSGTWSGSTTSGANSPGSAYSVSGTTVTYNYVAGYNFPTGSTSTSWNTNNTPWPSAETYSSNTCSGASVNTGGRTISGTASGSCTLTTTYSGSSSYGSSMTGPTGDGWFDSGVTYSIGASASGAFSFSSWTSSSGSLSVGSPSSASTNVSVNNYGTVTANFNVNQ